MNILKSVLGEAFELALNSAGLAKNKADEVYGKLMNVSVGFVCLVLVMWVVNVSGAEGLNFVFFYVGALAILFVFLTPKVHIYAALLGMGAAELRDLDLSQGAANGIQKLHDVVLSMLYGFLLIAGALATWSFKESPAAFFPVLGMILLLSVMNAVYGSKGTAVAKSIVMVYASAVILVSLWDTVPKQTKEELWGSSNSEQRTPRQVQVVPSTELKEVAAHNFVIPAYSEVAVPRQGRACKANSHLGSAITSHLTPTSVVFRSNQSTDLYARVWLFDQGTSRNCMERYNLLTSQGKIF